MTVVGDTKRIVRLYCRTSTSTAAAVDRYHRELDRLRSQGVVDDVEVTSWPSRVELRSDADSAAAEAYEEFSAWARREGVDLAPAFSVREYESEFTGETGTALVTPVACLAVYRDDELVAAYPHVDDGETRTVEDAITDLEGRAGRELGVGPSTGAEEPAE